MENKYTHTRFPLSKSFKGRFPFKIGTTSFIYPDTYVQNVRLLAPVMDEIEILIFESLPSSLPSTSEIRSIADIARQTGLSLNIHLPTDVSLTDPDPAARHHAVEATSNVIRLTETLSPSTYTLHLPFDEWKNPDAVEPWLKRTRMSIEQLLSSGIDSEKISVETLNYPLSRIDALIDDLNLSICMDIGHMILHDVNLIAAFDRYGEKTTIFHLHGVHEKKDHLSLHRLSDARKDDVAHLLHRFTGIVSLEVFSLQNLIPSLEVLETIV